MKTGVWRWLPSRLFARLFTPLHASSTPRSAGLDDGPLSPVSDDRRLSGPSQPHLEALVARLGLDRERSPFSSLDSAAMSAALGSWRYLRDVD